MSANDDDQLSDRVGEILGHKVRVSRETGSLTVLDLGTFQFLLHTSKLPKTVTAEWIVGAIERKAKASADIKARRGVAVEKLHDYMRSCGLRPDGVSFYFTTFGFSVENLFRDGIAEAERILGESGIAYKRLEFSPAHWVVRVIL